MTTFHQSLLTSRITLIADLERNHRVIAPIKTHNAFDLSSSLVDDSALESLITRVKGSLCLRLTNVHILPFAYSSSGQLRLGDMMMMAMSN